jgi:hypothetical protein
MPHIFERHSTMNGRQHADRRAPAGSVLNSWHSNMYHMTYLQFIASGSRQMELLLELPDNAAVFEVSDFWIT